MSAPQHLSPAPTPEVQFLPTIFRRIAQGDIRMPAFQRGFAWKDGQVLELLESIYNGYPIGSVLLWRVNEKVLRVEQPARSFFPVVDERYPTHFVLDGLQRLSTLFAVFHFDSRLHPDKFNICFNARTQEFIPAREADPDAIPLNVVFRPSAFVSYHAKLQDKEDGDFLVTAAVSLLSTFQEYLVPLVTIAGREVKDVVAIFERVNNTGTRFGAVDFMRAVTWSDQFDLSEQLARLGERAQSAGFRISPSTLVKVLAISLGFGPNAEAMLEMRSASAGQLEAGVSEAIKLAERVIEFLKEELAVHSYDLVPYEAQFLALTGFLRDSRPPLRRHVASVIRWYWTASLNEDMQGRSEHQVARIVERMQRVRSPNSRPLSGRLVLDVGALKDRRFRWGSALSSALASMLAKRRCRSLLTGEEISVEDYMTATGGEAFVGLAPPDGVDKALGRSVPAGKVIANIVVTSPSERKQLKDTPAQDLLRSLKRDHPADWRDILESQLVPPNALAALAKGQVDAFLNQRAEALLIYAQTLGFSTPGAAGA